MTPVNNQAIADKLFRIIKLQLEDNTQAHELGQDGEYTKIQPDGNNAISSQEEYEKYTQALYNSLLKEDSKAKKLVKRMMGES